MTTGLLHRPAPAPPAAPGDSPPPEPSWTPSWPPATIARPLSVGCPGLGFDIMLGRNWTLSPLLLASLEVPSGRNGPGARQGLCPLCLHWAQWLGDVGDRRSSSWDPVGKGGSSGPRGANCSKAPGLDQAPAGVPGERWLECHQLALPSPSSLCPDPPEPGPCAQPTPYTPVPSSRPVLT